MSNLISVTVKSIGDQEIADKTHLINNKFIVTATESGGDTSIQYGFPKGLRTIVVDETGLDTTFQAATVEKIALSVVGVNGRSTPAETTKFLTSDIVLAVANPEDSSNSDITLVSGDVYTVDATLSGISDENVIGWKPYEIDENTTSLSVPSGAFVSAVAAVGITGDLEIVVADALGNEFLTDADLSGQAEVYGITTVNTGTLGSDITVTVGGGTGTAIIYLKLEKPV